MADAVLIATQLRFTHEVGGKVLLRGDYAAATELEALDMSVRGRDITGVFAGIIDQPHAVVCLLGQRHSSTIEPR